jgi:outer membrane receptor for ferrienterochelin and colicin
MSDRRRSVHLTAAVTSILSAPAVALGAGLVMTLAAVPYAQAQETASQLSGFVVDAEGKPIAGAAVTIVHVPSGTTANVTTGASGQFSATGLRVGGPYSVTAKAAGMQDAMVADLYTQLAQRSSVTLVAQPIAQLAGVEVTGSSERDVTIGAGSRFSSQDVRTLPSISRDIKDVVRIDPKAWIDPTNSDALEVAGVNNRYNSITIDGVRQSDDFGLNNNGYPTQRSPLSVEAIQDVSILTAPFSVEYGMFRGSTINVVTKSGTNEFSGSAYYYTGKDDLAGDRSKERELTFTFDEETHGGTFGGPIIKDKLFFFLSYEKLDRKAPQEFGPAGSGAAVEIKGVTQAEYDQVVNISTNVYGFDPGQRFDVLTEADEKILGKLDWNLSESQRASLSYQHTEGNEVITSNNSSSLNRISTPSNWYNRAITMDSASLQLFSDWTPWFSTEFKLARKEVEVRQDSLMGTDFAEMQIATAAIPDDPMTPANEFKPAGTVFVGSDEFRHANFLTNDLDAIKLKGSFFLGDHTLMLGYERETLEIFNLFVPRSSGLYVFSSIANFQNRTATSLSYTNAFTNVKEDGGAGFGYDVDSFYFQDEWQATPDLKLEAGVRLDKYSGSDQPLLNSNFAGRYGFANTSTLDGRDLVMPRIGFNWQWRPETTIYGGWGLFGGGSPNVWVSNSFSGDGVTVVSQSINSSSPAALQAGLSNVDGFNINQAVRANHTLLRGDGEVSVVDPNFEIPSQYRWNLGMKHTLPWDIEWTADIVLSRVKDEVLWKDLRLVQTGTAPDGRPRYTTRADTSPCNPPLTGTCVRPSGQDLLLTNTHQGEGTVFATDFSKTWRTRAGRFDAYFGYGHQDIKDVNSGTSSTARSNWDSFAVADPNNPGLETSNYEIEHQFKGLFSWRKAFFGDNETSIAVVAERRSGRPFSYTFGAGTGVFGDPRQSSRQRALFYVPGAAGTAADVIYEGLCSASEVNVVAGCASTASFSSGGAAAAQFRSDTDAFIESQELGRYRGKIVARNSGRSAWVTTLDLRLAQEIPIWRNARGVVSLDIENLANMIDNDWGQISQVSFIYVAPVLDVNRIATTGCPANAPSCYVYRPRLGFTGPTAPVSSITALNSVWRVQLGLRFEF